MSGIDVIIEDLDKHPSCPHGPTLLFSKHIGEGKRNFFACAACRDRKHCSFFIWQDELKKISSKNKKIWDQEKQKVLKQINHSKRFIVLNEVKNLPSKDRIFCSTCSKFVWDLKADKHEGHALIRNITDHQLCHPSEILPPLDNAKKEAQYLFSKSAVETVVTILKQLGIRHLLCIGTPRIHEYILNHCEDKVDSLLLDLDSRYHNFFGPMQFCWYNCFNHHFFFEDAKDIFSDFLKQDDPENLAVIMDPPFGGQVGPLAHTLGKIDQQFKMLNSVTKDLPVFWAFPYFMESHILNSLPNYKMLDYKVEYDNHPLFSDGPKGRKHGSPVRIFTNVNPCTITLPEDQGYKYCKQCKRWVSEENKHCKLCKDCTSKDGRTYKHCKDCGRCVKPTWEHCDKCKRCTQPDHKCGDILFTQLCFHCKEPGHKKRNCPKVNHEEIGKKRKLGIKTKSIKKKKKM